MDKKDALQQRPSGAAHPVDEAWWSLMPYSTKELNRWAAQNGIAKNDERFKSLKRHRRRRNVNLYNLSKRGGTDTGSATGLAGAFPDLEDEDEDGDNALDGETSGQPMDQRPDQQPHQRAARNWGENDRLLGADIDDVDDDDVDDHDDDVFEDNVADNQRPEHGAAASSPPPSLRPALSVTPVDFAGEVQRMNTSLGEICSELSQTQTHLVALGQMANMATSPIHAVVQQALQQGKGAAAATLRRLLERSLPELFFLAAESERRNVALQFRVARLEQANIRLTAEKSTTMIPALAAFEKLLSVTAESSPPDGAASPEVVGVWWRQFQEQARGIRDSVPPFTAATGATK